MFLHTTNGGADALDWAGHQANVCVRSYINPTVSALPLGELGDCLRCWAKGGAKNTIVLFRK